MPGLVHKLAPQCAIVFGRERDCPGEQLRLALATLGFENEHGQREGDESGTGHDPLGVNAHAGVTELPPAGVLRTCSEAVDQENNADDPDC